MRRHLYRLGVTVVPGTLPVSLLTAYGGETTAETPSVTSESPVQQMEQTVAEARVVTDAAGNVVEAPAELSRTAVTLLPWFFVIYAIDGIFRYMVPIDPGAMIVYTSYFSPRLDSGCAEPDTISTGSDFSISMKEVVSRGVQAMVIWDYQIEEAERFRTLGATLAMVRNRTAEDFQASFITIGQMLGKEERIEQFNIPYTEAYEHPQSFQEQANIMDKPKALYLCNAKLKLWGSDMLIAGTLELAGADSVATDLPSITIEEILAIDLDIIPISNLDFFTLADSYENRLDRQDWSQVSAVLNRHVYKTPTGIYRRDVPDMETPLVMCWLA